MEQKLGPERLLPHSDAFASEDEYVESLLNFVTTNELLTTLCGAVHVLDFFTSSPELYTRVLPQDWRDFFASHNIMDIIDLLVREDIPSISRELGSTWRDGPKPPETLLDYVWTVRKHLLDREPGGSQCSRNRAVKPVQKMARHVAVGMKVKKVHEVGLFASYIDSLSSSISNAEGEKVSHFVDFGSGQNYLGRALASDPYNRDIVAIESKQANAERAKEYDVLAKLVEREKIKRNKRAFREETPDVAGDTMKGEQPIPSVEWPVTGRGKIQYIDHRIENGTLHDVIDRIPVTTSSKNLMVISLHSCGNLVHHGLRSMILNPEVKAVAMVGCCYNLMTERLGPATYKLPELRPTTHGNPRLRKLGNAYDPHGFPMSTRFADYGDDKTSDPGSKGIRFNITSRMMAVQAPANWGEEDSESFFTRHFYRALLQRIFLDRGVVGTPTLECVGGMSPDAVVGGGTPIIIGSLRKACYASFTAYVRGALAKLELDPDRGYVFREKVGIMTDEEIEGYEKNFIEKKKELSVMWSLMAYSACVVEATVVVDRWVWLKEQDEVKEAWVEPVFDYKLSPRNLVVVGIKK